MDESQRLLIHEYLWKKLELIKPTNHLLSDSWDKYLILDEVDYLFKKRDYVKLNEIWEYYFRFGNFEELFPLLFQLLDPQKVDISILRDEHYWNFIIPILKSWPWWTCIKETRDEASQIIPIASKKWGRRLQYMMQGKDPVGYPLRGIPLPDTWGEHSQRTLIGDGSSLYLVFTLDILKSRILCFSQSNETDGEWTAPRCLTRFDVTDSWDIAYQDNAIYILMNQEILRLDPKRLKIDKFNRFQTYSLAQVFIRNSKPLKIFRIVGEGAHYGAYIFNAADNFASAKYSILPDQFTFEIKQMHAFEIRDGICVDTPFHYLSTADGKSWTIQAMPMEGRYSALDIAVRDKNSFAVYGGNLGILYYSKYYGSSTRTDLEYVVPSKYSSWENVDLAFQKGEPYVHLPGEGVIKVIRNKDSDKDGLTDLEESWLFTNPSDSDTDHDGILDGSDRNPRIPEKLQLGPEGLLIQTLKSKYDNETMAYFKKEFGDKSLDFFFYCPSHLKVPMRVDEGVREIWLNKRPKYGMSPYDDEWKIERDPTGRFFIISHGSNASGQSHLYEWDGEIFIHVLDFYEWES